MKSIVDEIEDKLARGRREADPPRGRARRPLGADRLRRGRRPRAARGGAAVLRPRAAVARLPLIELPADVTAGVGTGAVTPRSLVLLRHGETAWNPEGAPRATPTSHLDDAGRAQAATVAPRRWPALRPGPLCPATSCARRADGGATSPAATGLRVEPDARLREYDLGERAGLTLAEYAGRAPRSTPRGWPSDLDAVPGEETTAAGARPHRTRAPRGLPARRSGRARPASWCSHGAASRSRRSGCSAGPEPAAGRCRRWRTAAELRARRARRGGRRPAARLVQRDGRRCPPRTRFRFRRPGWLVFRRLPRLTAGSEHGAVAQLVAHLHGMQRVRGSSPLSSTKHAGQRHVSPTTRSPCKGKLPETPHISGRPSTDRRWDGRRPRSGPATSRLGIPRTRSPDPLSPLGDSNVGGRGGRCIVSRRPARAGRAGARTGAGREFKAE